jgi:DmsE family decaheme c-type cytochrome
MDQTRIPRAQATGHGAPLRAEGTCVRLIQRILLSLVLALGAWLQPGIALAQAAPAQALPELGTPAATRAQDNARRGLAEDAKCTRCHDENETRPILSIYQTPHGVRADSRTPTCQSCHGPSDKHLAGSAGSDVRPPPDVVFAKHTYAASSQGARADQCLTCHKGSRRGYWEGGQHETNGLACNDCHQVHQPVDKVRQRETQREVCFTCHQDQRADVHKISTHPLETGGKFTANLLGTPKMSCSDCHNPHGSTGPKMLKKATVVETCTSCHAEKRGPFLWEHQPVNEDCTNCHTPHGSNITPLLKDRAPFLCDTCHNGPHNSQAPYGAGAGGFQSPNSGLATTAGRYPNPSSSAAGRACMNCHVMVHGSNSPAGAFLHR